MMALRFGNEPALAETKIPDIEFSPLHCTPASKSDEGRDSSPYDKSENQIFTSYTLPELRAYFDDWYQNGRRLSRRVYWNEQTKEFTAPISEQTKISVPRRILASIQNHIIQILTSQYGQFLFFSDFGHGHFFTPNESGALLKENKQYEKVFNDEKTLILYHLGEEVDYRLQEQKDPKILQRFLHRNAIGTNRINEVKYVEAEDKTAEVNTVRKIPGYSEFLESVVYLNANKNGCFQYQFEGTKKFFDLRF